MLKYLKTKVNFLISNFYNLDQQIMTNLNEMKTTEQEKELMMFNLLEKNARYKYIRDLALKINLERIYCVINDIEYKEYTINDLDENYNFYERVDCSNIMRDGTSVITSVWSKEKLFDTGMKNYVSKHGLKNSLIDCDVDGLYLIDYGILFTYNDNHRICHAQLFNDYSIDINKHYRISKIQLNDNFLNIDVDCLDIYLTDKEKLFYKVLQIDYK